MTASIQYVVGMAPRKMGGGAALQGGGDHKIVSRVSQVDWTAVVMVESEVAYRTSVAGIAALQRRVTIQSDSGTH